MSEIKIRGEITFDPEAVGKPVLGGVILCGKIVHDAGVPVFELIFDYHVCYEKRASDGHEKVWLVSRRVADREKFPNWPQPEPEAV